MTDFSEVYESEVKDNLLDKGAIAIVPRGVSMWPILKDKAQSVIIVTKKERLKPMDVALYERTNTLVLHRVMKVLEDGYVMCGDSLLDYEKVLEDKVFGVLEGYYHGEKYISCQDEKYIKKVKKWYGRKTLRKIRIKIFYFKRRVKFKLKSIFCKEK